ncbi:MAG: hypothetical protein ACE5FT_05965 [Candidatus Nanoarchaeia archaeon]
MANGLGVIKPVKRAVPMRELYKVVPAKAYEMSALRDQLSEEEFIRLAKVAANLPDGLDFEDLVSKSSILEKGDGKNPEIFPAALAIKYEHRRSILETLTRREGIVGGIATTAQYMFDKDLDALLSHEYGGYSATISSGSVEKIGQNQLMFATVGGDALADVIVMGNALCYATLMDTSLAGAIALSGLRGAVPCNDSLEGAILKGDSFHGATPGGKSLRNAVAKDHALEDSCLMGDSLSNAKLIDYAGKNAALFHNTLSNAYIGKNALMGAEDSRTRQEVTEAGK